jgi:hypothetical protein
MNLLKRVSLVFFVSLLALSVRAGDPAIGKEAPTFLLKSIEGKDTSLAAFRGKPVVLEWVNQGCPFVKKHYSAGNMQSLQKETQKPSPRSDTSPLRYRMTTLTRANTKKRTSKI